MMPDPSELDRQFRSLQDAMVHTYEERLVQHRQRAEASQRRRQQREHQEREIMRAANVDVGRIDRLVEEDEAAANEFVQEVRPRLLQHPFMGVENANRQALRLSLQTHNSIVVPVYGATLLATDPANISGNPGVTGNPWVFPWNPGQVKMKATDWGEGWGCWAQPRHPADQTDAQVTFYFPFIPDQTATWDLLTLVDLMGFYIIYADDGFWTCKESAAKVQVTMDVYQYFWNGAQQFPLIDIDESNINQEQLITEYGNYFYRVALREGDWAFVALTVGIHTFAKGGGSYSEINFADGTGNYIVPLITAAWR
jgi:hypothetical protein